MKRRVVSLLLTAILLVGMMPATVLADSVQAEYSERGAATREMIEAKLIEEFGEEFVRNHERSRYNRQQIADSLPRNAAGQTVYPEDFGGLYIDDNGNVVVLVAGSDEDSILRTFAEIEGVTVREVEFSERELDTVVNYLRGLVFRQYFVDGQQHLPRSTHPDSPLANMNGYGIDTINNRVLVSLYDYSPETIEHFRRTILDSPMLSFHQVEINHDWFQEREPTSAIPPVEPQVDGYADVAPLRIIPPGTPITFWRRIGSSWQYRGGGGTGYLARTRASNRIGFVTVSHGVDGVASLRHNDTITISACGTTIGTVYSVAGQGHDAAFIELAPGITLSRDLWVGSLNTAYANPRVGDMVFVYGATVSLRMGMLRYERRDNAHEGGPGFWVFRAAHLSQSTQHGDSGSISFTADGGRASSLGIVIGPSSAPNSNTVVSRAEFINTLHRNPETGEVWLGLNLNLR